jgi:hypothetical protein
MLDNSAPPAQCRETPWHRRYGRRTNARKTPLPLWLPKSEPAEALCTVRKRPEHDYRIGLNRPAVRSPGRFRPSRADHSACCRSDHRRGPSAAGAPRRPTPLLGRRTCQESELALSSRPSSTRPEMRQHEIVVVQVESIGGTGPAAQRADPVPYHLAARSCRSARSPARGEAAPPPPRRRW